MQHVLLLFVLGVSHRLKVVIVSRRAARVLGKCTAFPSKPAGITRFRIRHKNSFQQQVMPPAITEVVQVLEMGSDARHNLPQAYSALVDDSALVQIVVRVGHAINTATDHKLWK
jgi:hypothetical protein